MAIFKIFRETTLPGALQSDSLYVIAPAGTPNYFELYAVNGAGVVRRIPTDADITAKINTALATISSLTVVADIAARNALVPTANMQVLVKDATGDATVASGAATYVYEIATTTWTKISEFESLDVVLNWAGIVGKPSSSSAAIDAAVAATHTHANKTQLDQISEVSGEAAYNGVIIKTSWSSVGW
ncbi:MAG: hypothetical protein Q7K57_25110 [Burkholderiaceae bacterium]|nr:hypothetical protein [Burkholderiaceae bacterium]